MNKLSGRIPDSIGNIGNTSDAGNENLCGGIPQIHLAPCPNFVVSKDIRWRPNSLKIALPTIGTILVLVSAIILILLHHRKLRRKQNSQPTSPVIEQEYQRVSYYALLRGSNDFSDANLLGKGRYGSVYRCNLESGTIMAVKVFNLQQSGSSRSFEAECEALRRVCHRCLIKIITCSSIDSQGQEFKALIFEFMPNGSLDGWIHPKSSNPTPSNTLSLSQRISIAVDILGAMDYLHNHCQPSIIHCDSLGILLLEMFTGRSPTDDIFRDSMDLHRFVAASFLDRALEIADPIIWLHEETNDSDVINASIKTRIIPQCLVSVLRLGISCSKQQPRERMLLAEALSEMHAIRDDYLRSQTVDHAEHSTLS